MAKLVGWRKSRWLIAFTIALAVAGLTGQRPAMASYHRYYPRKNSRRRHHRKVPLYHAALLEDADSGDVLFESNGELEWPPASMAKMMLLLLAEDQIKAGRVSLDDPVRISKRSAATGGSRLGLREGEVYPLGELMKAALIRSANDAAVAVAEKIAGSVKAAVGMMNERAQKMGMTGTWYETVDGLPPRPGHDVDRTTALDLATLAKALIHTTGLLKWSGEERAPFDGGVALLRNTNHLVGHFEGCDGLKTGYTFESGFNLTATAKRGNMRLISVVLGAPSNSQRFIQSARLLEWGFDNFERVSVLRKGQLLPVEVHVASGPVVQPVSGRALDLVMRKSDVSGIKIDYRVPLTVEGPLAIGDPVGQVIVRDSSGVVGRVEAICPIAVAAPQGGAVNPIDLRPAASADGSNQPQEIR